MTIYTGSSVTITPLDANSVSVDVADGTPPSPPPPPPPVTATWNIFDKGSTIELSNGDLDATLTANGWRLVRDTLGHISGRHYAEMEITAFDHAINTALFGLADAGPSTGSYMYASANGAGCRSKSDGGNNSATGWTKVWTGVPATAAPVVGDRWMIMLDSDAGKAWIGKNGTWLSGDPGAGSGEWLSGIAERAFLCWSAYTAGASVRLHVSQANFAYALPTNTNPWDTP